MITSRSGRVLNYIVSQYIIGAVPVPSQDVADKASLGVSPATIRNEMAQLEKDGYLIRPHTSAGCIPSDKGYRYYVESIEKVTLPREEQYLISHTFHQVEKEVEAWVSLTATLLARLTQNIAVVSLPKSTDCKLKHMEIMAVQDSRALAVVVLDGAVVKQKLITFDEPVTQDALSAVSNKLNGVYAGLTGRQISQNKAELSPLEKKATEYLVEIMHTEDSKEYQDPYLEGWHFMLNQPEFAHSDQMRNLMELVERRGLLKVIVPARLNQAGVHVIIGKENQYEAIQNCSVVVCRYGLPDEVSGTIAVVGPTRMPYTHTIPTVYYLSSVLSQLLGGLYGKNTQADPTKS
ncbi:MAG: heat-inducible transcription repressor HrcA [Chloroflexi bacterium RBG_13_52_12]|nr:MAG: heat-inducible transcription repressor HrcA [Chloroflexi bacterium RBG_13_52_12]